MFNLSFTLDKMRNYFTSAPAAGRAEGPTADGPINEITDLALISMFVELREDLGRMACVNKRWNAIAHSEPLYKELYIKVAPTGRADWIAQNFGDPGEEPRIPLEWFSKLEVGKHLLTLVPKSVIKGNGEVVLITALNMGKMWAERMEIKEPQNRPGYTNDSWTGAICEDRPAEETHWVWFKGNEVIGRSKIYQEQEILAREQGGEVSGLIDTIVTMLMAREKYFEWDPAAKKLTLVRVQDGTGGWRVVVGFARAGLHVHYNYDNAYPHFGVVAARKSIGH